MLVPPLNRFAINITSVLSRSKLASQGHVKALVQFVLLNLPIRMLNYDWNFAYVQQIVFVKMDSPVARALDKLMIDFITFLSVVLVPNSSFYVISAF